MKNLKKRSEVKKQFLKFPKSDSEPELLLFEKFCRKGYRPNKQFQIGLFFVDLAFPKEKIAIEYDGIHHQEQIREDMERQMFIENKGWEVNRIVNVGNCYQLYHGSEVGHAFIIMEDAMDCLVSEIAHKFRFDKFHRGDIFTNAELEKHKALLKINEKII